MFVCLCHPFSDKAVKKHLAAKNGRSTVAETYAACSGGENPDCCQCLATLRDIVKAHNNTAAA